MAGEFYDDIIGAEDIFSGAGDIISGANDIFSGAGDIFSGAEGNPFYDDIIGADRELNALLAGGSRPQGRVFSGAGDIFGTRFSGDSIFGAEASAALAVQDANKNAMLRQLASRHAAAVMPRPVTKAREYPLGFPTTVLGAGVTLNITTSPQVPFRGRRLVIPSDIAGALLLNDLKVGKNSMFAASGPVPARMFSEFGVGVDLNLDTAQISQQITLNVTNSSGASVTFNAAMIGTAVE